MRGSDLSFILSVLQGEKVKYKPSDWYSVLGFLEFHRINVYFYGKALEIGIEIPERIAKVLFESSSEQKLLCQKKAEYLHMVSIALERAKINHAFLKGSILQCTYFQQLTNEYFSCRRYPQKIQIYKEGERNGNDIDILVSQKDLSNISEVLRALGFRQGRYDSKERKFIGFSREEILTRRMNRGETAPYLLMTEDPLLPFVEVDVNFSLHNLPGDKDVDGFLENTKIINGVRTLEQNKFFLHLLAHQYKEISLYDMWRRNKNQSLYKFLDIYLFLKNGLVSYGELYGYCQKENIRQICCSTIADVVSIFESLKEKRALVEFLQDIHASTRSQEVIDYNSHKTFTVTEGIFKRYLYFEQRRFLRERKGYE